VERFTGSSIGTYLADEPREETIRVAVSHDPIMTLNLGVRGTLLPNSALR